MDQDTPQPIPTPDEGDVEGHSFKWTVEETPKGLKRIRQSWDPDSSPPGRPDRPRTPEQPKGR